MIPLLQNYGNKQNCEIMVFSKTLDGFPVLKCGFNTNDTNRANGAKALKICAFRFIRGIGVERFFVLEKAMLRSFSKTIQAPLRKIAEARRVEPLQASLFFRNPEVEIRHLTACAESLIGPGKDG